MSTLFLKQKLTDINMTTSIFRRISIALIAVLLLTACLPGASGTPTSPTATLLPPATNTPFQPETFTPAAIPSETSTITPTPLPQVARVLIISVDGMRPDAIALAPMPNLQSLMEQGTYTLSAQTIFPSATLPAHSSMLTGLCPSKHGVDWNDYLPEKGYAKGTGLFDLAQAASLRTVMVVGKEKLRQITQPQNTDVYEYINDRDTVIAARVAELIPEGFGLMFVHFPTPDGMGHLYGWLSPEQLSVLRRSDEAIGSILQALSDANMRAGTLVIITADHGGHNTSHGSRLPEDMTIPWIMLGPGVQPLLLTEPVNTTDTAATAAWALGLPIPADWDGKPVTEAFGLPSQPRLDPRCP
jgi:hypothetical protein